LSGATLRLSSFAFIECKDTKKIGDLQIFRVKKHAYFSKVKRNLIRVHHRRSDVRLDVRYDVRFMLGFMLGISGITIAQNTFK